MSQDLIFNFESRDENDTKSVVNFYIGTSDDNLSDTGSEWTDIVSKSANESTDDELADDESTDDESTDVSRRCCCGGPVSSIDNSLTGNEPANDIQNNIISKPDNELSRDESTDDKSTDNDSTDVDSDIISNWPVAFNNDNQTTKKNIVKTITKTYYNVNYIDGNDSEYEYIHESMNENKPKIKQSDISKIIIKKIITKNNNIENNKIISSKQTTSSEIEFYYN